MASSIDGNSQVDSFEPKADMDDLLASGGFATKRQKEPMTEPSVPGESFPSLESDSHQPLDHRTEAMGLPDSLTSGTALSDGDYNKGHASGSASQPSLTVLNQ